MEPSLRTGGVGVAGIWAGLLVGLFCGEAIASGNDVFDEIISVCVGAGEGVLVGVGVLVDTPGSTVGKTENALIVSSSDDTCVC